MTATLPFPTRYLAILGVTLLVAALFFVVRPLLAGDDSTESAVTPATPVTQAGGGTTPTQPTTPAKPQVELVKGLPRPVWNGLQKERVLVVQIYSGTSGADRAMVATARRGAKATGAGFASMNVLDELRAREVSSFVGAVDTPTVLIVKRPGKIVTLIEGPVDAAIVEQAAHNAGARG